jgi:PAS domain S-box-containing protein
MEICGGAMTSIATLHDFPDVTVMDLDQMGRIERRLQAQVEALSAGTMELAELFEGQLTLGDRLSKMSDLRDILPECLNAAVQVDSMDSGGIYLIEDDEMVLKEHTGLSAEFVKKVGRYSRGSLHWKMMMMKGEPQYLVEGDAAFERLGTHLKDPGLTALAVIPVCSGGELLGCFNISSHQVAEFPRFVRVALELLTHQLADVVARAVSYERLKNAWYKAQVLSDAGYEAILVHRDGEVVAANNSWTRMTGWTEQQTKKLGLMQLFTPDSLPMVKAQVESNIHVPYKAQIRTPDGGTVLVMVKTQDVIYKNGEEVKCRAKVITPFKSRGDDSAR